VLRLAALTDANAGNLAGTRRAKAGSLVGTGSLLGAERNAPVNSLRVLPAAGTVSLNSCGVQAVRSWGPLDDWWQQPLKQWSVNKI